jgi:putative transposase
VRCPRVRDRVGEGSERIRFSSAILPPYARRSKSLEVLIPILYLKGVSTGDFEEALVALLGRRSRPHPRLLRIRPPGVRAAASCLYFG